MSHFDLYKRTKQAVDSNALIFIAIAVCIVGGLAVLLWMSR